MVQPWISGGMLEKLVIQNDILDYIYKQTGDFIIMLACTSWMEYISKLVISGFASTFEIIQTKQYRNLVKSPGGKRETEQH